MNRDPARPEGALLGLWRVLRTPLDPLLGPWGALPDPPGRSFPGVLAEMPVLGGSGGSQGGAQGSQVASPGGPGPLRWGPGYIEGFNMYTGVWRGSKCSGGSLSGSPRMKMSSPDANRALDRPVRPGLSSRDASTIRRSSRNRGCWRTCLDPAWGPLGGPNRGVRGSGGPPTGVPGPLVWALGLKLRRLRGQNFTKIWPNFGFLHLNRDPARPEGALLGQISALGPLLGPPDGHPGPLAGLLGPLGPPLRPP